MIHATCFSEKYIRLKAKELRATDPLLLEKSIHALALLGHLADSGLPFVFKGGTSVMLLLDPIRRLTHEPWRCLNRLLGVNPEAFHYWHCASQFM